MPIYCYETSGGEIIEHWVFKPEPPLTITTADGESAVRCVTAEHNPNYRRTRAWSEPIESLSLGVNPVQVPEAEKAYLDAGIPTKFNPVTGDMKITDREHRNRVMKFNQVKDLDAGYGDWSGR